MSAPKSLADQFYEYVLVTIDDGGIYPAPMFALDNDGKLEIHALAIPADQILAHAALEFGKGKEVLFGIDRFTRPKQDTTLSNVLTCIHLIPGAEPRFGVIEYEVDPRRVLPWNWDNEFWKRQLTREMNSVLKAALTQL